jgi:hypothetical protein
MADTDIEAILRVADPLLCGNKAENKEFVRRTFDAFLAGRAGTLEFAGDTHSDLRKVGHHLAQENGCAH